MALPNTRQQNLLGSLDLNQALHVHRHGNTTSPLTSVTQLILSLCQQREFPTAFFQTTSPVLPTEIDVKERAKGMGHCDYS